MLNIFFIETLFVILKENMIAKQEYILYKGGKIYARIQDPLQAQIVAHNQKASVYFTYNNHETFISTYE
tara:strand:+ start:247 stop:453 length:207 start_codon:yes stop_codon:yes gene_type:complete